ncbi:epoxide hydrolase family protein [Actinacidiphila guanduensis]|uniref:Pimeloyl-ACP methyl ester carboxylesterase n=1 Tax=Actinacidiphila guanduensis TaxID=310781 RepID=A0A1G9W261_9ACTN|nr:epoxide hydrolase family protein [Actinacidiphila guanduensis]SDM78297.1 Pimeloyl-ACP methyl ester carboxylesterase [Actinacidiphila guanduensis]
MKTTPFTIAISDEQLEDLTRRLRNTRWPDAVDGMDWEDGTDLAFLRRLTDHWQNRFDWRAQEARLNALPQFTADVDGIGIHFIHRHGTGPAPYPLVLTHGWPGTGFDMERIIPLLTDPGAHGGDPADAFDVVVPSIPGYGFSQRPERPGLGPEQVAGLWAHLMTGLGYERFGAQAGDWGAAVSTWLAHRHPGRVTGLHLNFVPGAFRPPLGEGEPPLTEEEKAFIDSSATWFAAEGGYHHLHSTKPQTPAYALTDSPTGLAAWIVEKLRGWSDCDGDVEQVFSLDQILTLVSIYWFTGTIGSSMRFYREDRLNPTRFAPGERVMPPLGVAAFPKDNMPPRSWVERVFDDVARWTDMPRGGHFGPMEAAGTLAEEIRAFFRPIRKKSS